MNIRPYQEKDIEHIVEIYNNATLKVNWVDLSEEQKKVMLFKDLKIAHELMITNITLILQDNNGIKGFAMMTRDGYIRFLYVDINYLGKGYGRKLILAIEEVAKSLGIKKVYLHSSEFAARNKIYEKLGYQNKGKEIYKIVGVEFVGNRMEKSL